MDTEAEQSQWLSKKVERYQSSVDIMDRAVRNHQQTAYVVPQNSLQKYRYFVQRVTPDIGTAFQTMEENI